jgi:hypothetical protein
VRAASPQRFAAKKKIAGKKNYPQLLTKKR